MSWRKKAALAVADDGGLLTDKTDKRGSVSFVSADPATFPPQTAPNGAGKDPAAESRKARALAFLEAYPAVQRVCFADAQSDPAHIVFTIALREPWGAVELHVDRERFDVFALIDLTRRYPDTSAFIPNH